METQRSPALVGRGWLVFGWGAVALLGVSVLGLHATLYPPIPVETWRPDPYGDRTLLADGPVTTRTGNRYAVTDSLQAFDRTVRIGSHDEGLVLDRTPLTCHGGRAQITWHTGNLEPTVPDTYIHLTIRLDREPLATGMKGSTRGIYDDGPVDIRAVVDCPAGEHVVDLLVRKVTGGGWGIPYVVAPGQPTEEGLAMLRGFVIEEVY